MKSSVSDLKLEKVLIKISGEFLAGNLDFGINPSTLNTISKAIKINLKYVFSVLSV